MTKTVLLTGATGNIGTACNTLFKANDWHTVLWSKHGRNNTHSVDLARWYTAEYQLVKTPNLDMVIMAHGIQQPNLIGNFTLEYWQHMLDNNLTSCVGLTHNLIKYNKLNRDALVIYCSSIQANTPRAGRGAYAIAKAGLEALTKTIAVELAPLGIRAIALRLGQLTETMQGINFKEEEKIILQSRALMSWITPEDVAKFCYDLYEQKSMTGCVIDFDSGQGRNVW